MILQPVNTIQVERLGDLDEGITAGIDESSLPFMFEILSKGFYSNPIGSICREVTSNCFDSHIEADVPDPVIISQSYSNDEGFAIEFKDVGVGMSTERVKKIFMNYFSSTKRESNLQIGGFGLGSKSPLSYADMFYITTIFDGLKYEYLFHKGENGKPTLESILGYDEDYFTEDVIEWNDDTKEFDITGTREVLTKTPIGEPTEEHNGTVIKINIERNDLSKFTDELKFQLAYFDNVYFSKWGISNDYDIYEGEHFKFRSDMKQAKYSYDEGTDIHLCIGKVRYPIDFSKVKVASEFKKIPVAVKFEIGELNVTPNRETIRYNETTNQLILDRVKLAANEIIKLFESQNPEVENLREYIDLMNDKPKITFTNEQGTTHYLYLWQDSQVDKKFRFKPLSGLPIKKTPKNLFPMWEIIGTIRDGKRVDHTRTETIDNSFVLTHKYLIVKKEDRYSTYIDLYINEAFNYNVTLIRRKKLDYEEITKSLGIKEAKDVRKAKTIKDYITIMNKIVIDNGNYYSSYRPTEDWIKEYKKSVRESSAAWIRKHNKKVFVRDASYSFRGIELKVDELQRRTGILIYGYKEDQDILGRIYSTVISNKASLLKIKNSSSYDRRGNYVDNDKKLKQAFMVIQISKSVEKDIIPDPIFDKKTKKWKPVKTIYWKDFFKTKFFKKIEFARFEYNKLIDVQLNSMTLREKFLRDFKEQHEAAKKSIVDYGTDKRSSFNIPSEYIVDPIRKRNTPVDLFIKNQNFEVPFFKIINTYFDVDGLQEVVSYLKYKKVKLRTEFYLKDRRQLKYEAALKNILNTFKYTQNNLLTYTLNQTENVSEENITTSSSIQESSSEESTIPNYEDYF